MMKYHIRIRDPKAQMTAGIFTKIPVQILRKLDSLKKHIMKTQKKIIFLRYPSRRFFLPDGFVLLRNKCPQFAGIVFSLLSS